MTFDCPDVQSLAGCWAREGESALEGESLNFLQEHLSRCTRCSSRYGSLAGLLAFRTPSGVAPSEETNSLAERVMAGISQEYRAVPRVKPAFALPSVPFAAAAAALAVLIFASGFVFGSRMKNDPGDFVSVKFALEAPAASSVGLVGYFPDSPVAERTPMTRDGTGVWTVTVRLRRDGVYSYSFLIDGKDLLPDPAAEEWVDDGFGGRDSLLRL